MTTKQSILADAQVNPRNSSQRGQPPPSSKVSHSHRRAQRVGAGVCPWAGTPTVQKEDGDRECALLIDRPAARPPSGRRPSWADHRPPVVAGKSAAQDGPARDAGHADAEATLRTGTPARPGEEGGQGVARRQTVAPPGDRLGSVRGRKCRAGVPADHSLGLPRTSTSDYTTRGALTRNTRGAH